MEVSSPQFAQIPFEVICRFAELSKVEIIVFSCLLGHKNQGTGLCNPKPILVAKETRLDKGNVSKAIKSLEAKEWIIWLENGEFLFPILRQKVVNLTTFDEEEKLLIQQPKVVNSTTQVVNLTTPLNKDLEHKNNIKENKEREVARAPSNHSKKGSRIPDKFFLTSEMKSWAAADCPGVDFISETKAFVDHFRSATGRNATKLDWIAAWRNWIRREFKTLKPKNGGHKQNGKSNGKFTDKNEKFDASLDEFANDPAFGFASHGAG